MRGRSVSRLQARLVTASALVGVSVLAAATPVAAASTVTRVEAQITFTAASGDENDVSMTLAAGMYTITDAGAPITPGAGCSALDANTVTCASDGVTVIVAALGDRNESLTNGTPTASVTYGGPGHDRLFGGSGPDELSGGDGEDELRGLQGADLLDGGRHADLLDGGDGADDVRGNRGRDTASYEGRLASVRASLDNKPNDGGFGEHDNVRRDVEHIIGGSGPDTLIGNAQPNDLLGLGGRTCSMAEGARIGCSAGRAGTRSWPPGTPPGT